MFRAKGARLEWKRARGLLRARGCGRRALTPPRHGRGHHIRGATVGARQAAARCAASERAAARVREELRSAYNDEAASLSDLATHVIDLAHAPELESPAARLARAAAVRAGSPR